MIFVPLPPEGGGTIGRVLQGRSTYFLRWFDPYDSFLSLLCNQVLLLKKIEELTLYMIEMDKKTDRLEAENASLRKELEQLKKK